MPKKQKKEKRVCNGCKHGARFHYRSNADISEGQIFCSKDNCTNWGRCDQKDWKEETLLGKHK